MDVEGGDFVGEPRPNDRVRLLVVGDAGVGKSSLIHLACHGAVLRGATSTVGCHVDAKLHSYYGTSFFVEFVEVGGAEKFRSARSVFFMQRFDGVVMMHDLTNRNSRANLDRWRRELQDVRHDERHADGRNSAEFADEHGGGNGDGNGGMHDVDLSSNSRGSGSSRDPWAAQLPERSPGQALNRRQGASPGPAEEWVNTGEMVCAHARKICLTHTSHPWRVIRSACYHRLLR